MKEIDLHPGSIPRRFVKSNTKQDAMDYLHATVQECKKNGLRELKIITGNGSGVLKSEVMKYLSQKKSQKIIQDYHEMFYSSAFMVSF